MNKENTIFKTRNGKLYIVCDVDYYSTNNNEAIVDLVKSMKMYLGDAETGVIIANTSTTLKEFEEMFINNETEQTNTN